MVESIFDKISLHSRNTNNRGYFNIHMVEPTNNINFTLEIINNFKVRLNRTILT